MDLPSQVLRDVKFSFDERPVDRQFRRRRAQLLSSPSFHLPPRVDQAIHDGNVGDGDVCSSCGRRRHIARDAPERAVSTAGGTRE